MGPFSVCFLSVFCPTRFERGCGNRGPAVPLCCSGFRRLRCCGVERRLQFHPTLCVGVLYFILYIYTYIFLFFPPPNSATVSLSLFSSPRQMGGCCPHQWVNPWRKYANPPLLLVLFARLFTPVRLYAPITQRSPPLHGQDFLQPAPFYSLLHHTGGHAASAQLGCFVFEAAAERPAELHALGAEFGH